LIRSRGLGGEQVYRSLSKHFGWGYLHLSDPPSDTYARLSRFWILDPRF
jgi:hypothetical protein